MKTKFHLLLIVSALLCFAFTQCKKKPEGEDKVAVRSIVISQSTLELQMEFDPTASLTVDFYPPHATDKRVVWSSDDAAESVISVDAAGRVTATGVGTTTVTATSVDGGFTDQCEVTVLPYREQVEGMLFIESGTFEMGGDHDLSNPDELPIHTVTLSDYYIGIYEVTRDEWREVMGSLPATPATTGLDHPVENVSWNDVQGFLTKLNEQSPGRKYRLPTEAEWEYAARGGYKSEGYMFSGSNSLDDVAWWADNNGDDPLATHPAGQKKPNELGLYDMTGNVWEWCGDYYATKYPAEPQTDPTGPAEPSDSRNLRVLRGGSNITMDYVGHTTDRNYYGPDVRQPHIGFRLVMTLDD